MSEVREFCVKMRASRCGEHVSGAERIVDERLVPRAVAALAERALSHEKGTPDFINIKVEEPGEMVRLKALAVSTNEVSTAAEGRTRAAQLLDRKSVV